MTNKREGFIQDILGRVYKDLPKAEELSVREWEALGPEAQGRVVADSLQRLEQSGQQVAPPLKKLISENKFADLAGAILGHIWKSRRERAKTLIEEGTPNKFRGLTPDEQEAYIENVAQVGTDMGMIE